MCLTWSKTPKAGFLTTVLNSELWKYIKNVSLDLYFHSFEAIIKFIDTIVYTFHKTVRSKFTL